MLTVVLPMAAVAADLASQAATLTADVPHGMVLYLKHCASCHGQRAWGDGPGSDMHGPAMRDSLRPADVDRAQALRDLGAWLSHAVPNREPEHGAGQALSAGKRAYANACAGRLAHAPGVGAGTVGSADQQQAIADYVSRLTLASPASEK